ncbi:MAG: hypothetical protein RL226_2329, partial [Bacteroidota bacterium]
FVGNPLVQNYFYQVFVTDLNTGCEKWSLMFLVTESPDCPGDCTPEPFVCNIQSIPNCNQGTFTAVGSNFTVVQWSFGDTNFGGGNPASHVYLAAGCYNVQLTIAVPNIIPGEPDCLITIDDSICIPLGVDFDIDYVGCGQIDFTDLSSWIAGPGNAITSYSWNFGDGSPLGSGTTPSHTYANPGVYNVTLTVTNGNGCVSSISHPVTITSVGVPTLTYSPATVCVGEPVSFSSVATSAVTYTWNFGDGATFVGPSPSHTYTSVPMGGSATVTVTAQDADGCTKTSQVTFPVNPSPSGAITGPTTICQGDLATLTAPSGYAYQWVPGGQTTQTINVGGGTYSVILTNGFGCSIETAEVMVEEIPKPQVNISGNLIICDNGCTTLFATYGDGWSYTWYDDVNNVVGFGPSLTVCSGSLANNYKVEVVNAFGCIGNAGPVAVTVAASPVYTVLVNGTLCEGDPTVLTVTPNLPNWTYTWSSGGNGPVTTVSALGNHTVVVTDIDSGCSSSHTETVNPKPDFCAVPSGCYTSCFGDEVCGDPGMVSYQWNFNGTPITGETGQCIFVMQSGVYTVTETNSFGCTDTSGPIVFELVDCSSNPCDSLFVEYAYLVDPVTNETDSCCVTLSYTNNYGPVLGLSITSSDADLVFSNISSSLQIQSILPNGIELGSIIPTTSIPQGVLNNVATFCLTDVINNPQEVVIHWYDMDASIICPDTLIFNCPVEPDCLYLTNDTIYCDGVETLYEFTVCNPNDADWAVSYISLVPTSPTGIVLSPSAIDLTANPLQPGDCATFTLSLSGAGIEGQTFCYNMVAHIDNPDLHPDALCCSLDTTYCIDIPFCDPCGFVDAFAEPLNEEDCCYNIVLNNGYNPNYFDAIDLCVISPQTTFTLNNPFGSGWTTSGYNGTVATLLPTGFGNFVPGGTSVLPELCIDTYVAPNQLIEVKWMHEGEVVCRDTLSFFCEPDCGYFTHDLVTCNDDGTWTFSADLVNNTGYAIGEAVISFAGALSVYNNSITLGNVPNGGVFSPIVFNIGAPAQPGDEICFTVTLHEINSDGIYLNCCNFTYCMILPDCGFTPPCACDEAFLNAGSAGMSCTANSALLYEYSFDLLSNLIQESCDQVRWNVTGIPGVTVLPGGAPFVYNFPAPGSYQVCARVYRTLPDGTTCKFMVCKDVVVLAVANITVYPNPGQGLFYVAMPKAIDDLTKFTVMDNVGRPVLDARLSRTESNVVELDLRSAAPGVYMLECVVDGRREVHKIVIQ